MQKQQGFISTIVIIIVALILLNIFFGFNIVEFIQKPEVQDILQKIWRLMLWLFHFIVDGLTYGWEVISGFFEKLGV